MANWSSNAKIVLEGRYVDRSKNETPDQMLVRVAKNISEAEKKPQEWENKFLALLDSLEFLPNSPCLINAGRELQQLSACFVLPIFDDLSHIFEMVKQSALIHKSGGGTGFNFSLIRPSGFTVKSTQGVASGPVSFMKCLSGDVEIASPNGSFKLKELVNRTVPVYSYDGRKVVISILSNVCITKVNSEIWEITLDNGEKIKATKDHLFMRRDGSFSRLDELRVGDGLMPFRRRIVQRVEINTNDGKLLHEEEVVAEWKYKRKREKGEIIHHIDGNPVNNNPDNIEFLSRKEHVLKHKIGRKKMLHSKGIKSKHVYSEEERKRISDRVSAKWGDPEYKKRMSKIHKSHSFNIPKDKVDEGRNKSVLVRLGKTYEEIYGVEKATEIKRRLSYRLSGINNPFFNRKHSEQTKRKISNSLKFRKGKNHKIVLIKKLDFCEDAYDATVEEFHNFALSAGVFVHNCFDVVTDVVKQGGVRRGANMGILNITHPDIVEFINCKKETERFNNFNISIALTDNFLGAAKRNMSIYLHHRGQLDAKPIKARHLLHLICENMHDNGEPGVLFLDTINRFNPIPWMGRIYATNPCIIGDTLIATADGRGSVSIKQLASEGKGVPIYCKDTDGWTHIRQGRNPRLTGKNKKILKVTLDNGSFVKVTEDHRFYLKNGDSIAAKDLVSGQSLMRFDRFQFKYKEQGLPYWSIQRARNNVFQEHRLITEFILGRKLTKTERVHHKNHNGLDNSQINLEVMSLQQHSELHDISGDKNPIRRFPEKNPWRSSNFNKRHCGHLLTEERKKNISVGVKKAFANDTTYRQRISKKVKSWYQNHPEGKQLLSEIRKKWWKDHLEYKQFCFGRNHKVISTAFVGYEDVYNITVDEFHNYCVVTSSTENHQSGVVLANCGEAPLLPYESCNLGSIDVSKFVLKTKAEIDWDRLKSVIKIAIRFLDNMIDMNHYPRVQIARMSRLTRKIGLGIMGWADLLAKLKVGYDSEQALGIAEKLMEFINAEVHKESEKIGKEKGFCFKQLGRRNSCLTTIAPTGALSILADCSNGIEPHYAKSYTKTVLNDKKLEFGTEHNVKTALEISPEWHVRVQAAFQEFVDQAISKTINIPESATVEVIEETILLAHSLGCKGLTVYRQNSREKAPLQEIGECQGDKCLI